MTTLLSNLLYLLGMLLLLILVIPVNFSFRVEYQMQLALQARIRWGAGLLSLEITHHRGQTDLLLGTLGLHRPLSSSHQGSDKANIKSSAQKPKTKSLIRLSSLLKQDFLSLVKLLLGRLREAIHLYVQLHGVYGFNDPASTGFAAAVIAATLWKSGSICLNPDFTQEIVDLQGKGHGWFIPLHIVILIMWFLMKKPFRAIWWPMVKNLRKHEEAVQYA